MNFSFAADAARLTADLRAVRDLVAMVWCFCDGRLIVEPIPILPAEVGDEEVVGESDRVEP